MIIVAALLIAAAIWVTRVEAGEWVVFTGGGGCSDGRCHAGGLAGGAYLGMNADTIIGAAVLLLVVLWATHAEASGFEEFEGCRLTQGSTTLAPEVEGPSKTLNTVSIRKSFVAAVHELPANKEGLRCSMIMLATGATKLVIGTRRKIIGRLDDFKLDKFIESKIYDSVARDMQAYCDQKARDPAGTTVFLAKLNRDVWQRTIEYRNHRVGEQGAMLTVLCPGESPEVAEIPEWWFDTGWSPGQMPGKYPRMGRAPKGWTFTEGNWLWQWEMRHCEVRPDKCTLEQPFGKGALL